jgi:hypothetical protein
LRTRECLSPFATKRTNGVKGSKLYQRKPLPYSYFTIFICWFSFCRPSLLIIYLIVPLSTSRLVFCGWLLQSLQPNVRIKSSNRTVDNESTSQKYHPFLPLTSATLSPPVATPNTVLPTHLHPVQRLRSGEAITPRILYALLECI